MLSHFLLHFLDSRDALILEYLLSLFIYTLLSVVLVLYRVQRVPQLVRNDSIDHGLQVLINLRQVVLNMSRYVDNLNLLLAITIRLVCLSPDLNVLEAADVVLIAFNCIHLIIIFLFVIQKLFTSQHLKDFVVNELRVHGEHVFKREERLLLLLCIVVNDLLILSFPVPEHTLHMALAGTCSSFLLVLFIS